MDYYSSKNNFFQNKEDFLLLSPRKISFKYLSIVLIYRLIILIITILHQSKGYDIT